MKMEPIVSSEIRQLELRRWGITQKGIIYVFGNCFIHILYTGCAKIKKKIIPAPKG